MEQHLNGRTQSMTMGERPVIRASHAHRPLSRAAEATRSLRLAEQLTGEARRAALADHFTEFAASQSSGSCRLR